MNWINNCRDWLDTVIDYSLNCQEGIILKKYASQNDLTKDL
jgi:hypothetical protein